MTLQRLSVTLDEGGKKRNKDFMGVIAYSFAGDRLAIHVSGRRGQGIPVSSFIIGDESCHSAIDLLIGKEDSFDSTDL